jgi:pimeloyl-ACP methyl ester carboxylesterase
MVTLHGMNTRGVWQEEFMWRVARSYRYAVPVAIYKYGLILSGAIVKFRQRALTRQLLRKAHALAGETAATGFCGRPDVVAHSLGTWLLGHALQADPGLLVGRVILVGSILRPDFNWADLIRREQVEAVLCHYSSKDCWARVAHYVIPDSGPSGRIGFLDRSTIIHAGTAVLSHTDYFKPGRMPELYTKVWEPFLTQPLEDLAALSDGTPSPGWHPASWPFRASIFRYVVLTLAAVLVLTGVAALILGLYHICHMVTQLDYLPMMLHR